MNILIHICCAPCAIYPAQALAGDGHKLAGYFYNPNIHPYSEYLKRRDEVQKFGRGAGINIISADYDIEIYFQHVAYNEAPRNRCPACWWLRLEKTAAYAKANGFEAFTSTLLGSPYQDHGVIRSVGDDIAKSHGLVFAYADFRVGFKEAHAAARLKGVYCQNYCGCVFSEHERIKKKDEKKPSGKQCPR